MAPKLQIYLVRHGQTEWNLTGQHTSFTDLPLTEEGMQQAILTGKKLQGISFHQVFSSPMERAIETCVKSGLGNQMHIMEDLCEWNYGKYEGITTAEIRKDVPGWMIFKNGAKGGESVADVEYRAIRLIEKFEKMEGNIALFTHGHFARVFGAVWIGLGAKEGGKLMLDNATLSILSYYRGERAIRTWNG